MFLVSHCVEGAITMALPTDVKEIPSHKKWKEWRDEAGGESNMVSKVNVGKLLDAFDKAGSSRVKRKEALANLISGLQQYEADKKVKKIAALSKLVKQIIACADRELVGMKALGDVGLQVGLAISEGLRDLAKIKRAPTALAYGKFYDGIGRGMGQFLPAGQLRDGWRQTVQDIPSREQVGAIEDEEDQQQAVIDACTLYEQALQQLLVDCTNAGMELKQH